MADDGRYRRMLVDVARKLSDRDVDDLAFELFTDRSVRNRIKDGRTLMDEMESAKFVSKNKVDHLLDILKRRNFHEAADEVQSYKKTLNSTNRNEGATSGKDDTKVDKNYLRNLSKKVGRKWRDVGRYLGFDEADLDNFLDNNPRNQQEAIAQMFNDWLETKGSKATYVVLAAALIGAGRRDLAETCHA